MSLLLSLLLPMSLMAIPAEPKDSFILFDQWVYPIAHMGVKLSEAPEKRKRVAPINTVKKRIILGIPTATVAYARKYALAKIGATQFSCLDRLWTKESHWNPFDLNRSSGAYGIPQAVPGSKMRSAGADWRTNPLTQVKWGLGYIRARYGTACNAWSHSMRHNWY